MRHFLIGLWAIARLAGAVVPQPELHITARVYNYANLPGDTLARAEAEATRVFQQIGVAVEWLDCSLGSGFPPQPAACNHPVRPTHLAVKLLPLEMMDGLHLGRVTMGFAALAGQSQFATDAFVCVPCIKELTGDSYLMREPDSPQAIILGGVMAHELGHLLIGKAGHSLAGIMHGPWKRAEMLLALQGRLGFTSAEGREIQAAVLSRALEECAARSFHPPVP
jgi:hypothetical protein